MDNKTLSRQITVSEMAPHVHSFYAGENKVHKIAYWLADWIKKSLEKGYIKENDFLPLKGDLAFHIGVSRSTIQNVYRMVEDMGYIESKQKIGTYISNRLKSERVEKLTSKRELACFKLKEYITKNKIQVGETLESIGSLAKHMQMSTATIRCAINSLIEEGILEKRNREFVLVGAVLSQLNVETKTLVVKISERIKQYIAQNLKIGDKIPSNTDFAQKYNVSVKTIYDAIKILQNEGIVYTRRGKYGTVVINSDSETELYIYEKIKIKIREYIIKNCKVGSKLPPIREMCQILNTSTKTIKNALDELADEGYVTFARGRYGGTFVTDIPQSSNDAYTWLAISPDYMQNN